MKRIRTKGGARLQGFRNPPAEARITQELEGEVDFDFAPDGVRCIIRLPLEWNMVPND